MLIDEKRNFIEEYYGFLKDREYLLEYAPKGRVDFADSKGRREDRTLSEASPDD